MSDAHSSKILGTATLNEKGQLVIPAEVRHELDLRAGSKLVIMHSPHGESIVLIKAEAVEAMVQGLAKVLEANNSSNETH